MDNTVIWSSCEFCYALELRAKSVATFLNLLVANSLKVKSWGHRVSQSSCNGFSFANNAINTVNFFALNLCQKFFLSVWMFYILFKTGALCGGHGYDTNSQECCCGVIHDKKTGHKCCGHNYYATSTHQCCEDENIRKTGENCPTLKGQNTIQ